MVPRGPAVKVDAVERVDSVDAKVRESVVYSRLLGPLRPLLSTCGAPYHSDPQHLSPVFFILAILDPFDLCGR
jgi:hypothetical protein